MFKKWRSDKVSRGKEKERDTAKRPQLTAFTRSFNSEQPTEKTESNGTPTSTQPTEGNTETRTQPLNKIDFPAYDLSLKPVDKQLEYKATSDDPDLPYGDGSYQVFGMENYGYTCYHASIFNALYWTRPLRHEILRFPRRDPSHPRKRKLRVAGVAPRGFTAAILEQREKGGEAQQADANGTAASGSGPPSTSSTAASSRMNGMKNLFRSGGEDDSAGTESEGAPLEDAELEKFTVSKYPDFGQLKVPYFSNNQGNLTIIGVTDNASDSSDQRKRHALLHGPIINLDKSFSNEYGMKPSLYTDLKDAFECIAENESRRGIMSDYHLIEMAKEKNEMFRGAMHQDAHEFLNFLVNSLIETANAYSSEHPTQQSHLPGIFEGLLTSETKCLSCESVSTRDEKFLDLSIDLQQNTSLTNCLKMFSQSEMLTGSNKFFCEKCHSLQEAAKTIKLKKLPPILALHLKRFKYSEELGRMVKLFYRVEYTKTLRIFNITDDSPVQDKLYELYAVVVHIGGGPYHGHYVALIKTDRYGWLLFDDETVESIDENYVYRFFGDGPGFSAAYILFYREIDDEETFRDSQQYNGFDEGDNCLDPYADSPADTSVDTILMNQSNQRAQNQKKKNRLTLNFMKL